jgi:hypothetical protein
MSRWFHDYVRRGGRVHRDGVSASLYSRMRREADARARRRRAFEAGQQHGVKVLFALVLLGALFTALAWLWEL